ncbi:MAG: BrnT family toxin [Parvibaculum sp.]|uniref:BrnT family toxin n=1 Tax=Parvibaculum sp. TaxID=2024848 RepID=UPI001E02A5B5|nr:BrnT family toxin [Parvibaculum sp.]MBX3488163.1 BrnT family toxin [Parvibaculum sp.]MBX3496982.1 BrnT family toxin [Parvibaculum sp.]MCW5727859.1 BrnT family toxin [Parvibaculum sp.]
MFTWDEKKRAANKIKHGVDFATVEDFEFDAALIHVDDRFDYGEVREVALGPIGRRLYVLVFTRRGDSVQVISLRKANAKEEAAYGRR